MALLKFIVIGVMAVSHSKSQDSIVFIVVESGLYSLVHMSRVYGTTWFGSMWAGYTIMEIFDLVQMILCKYHFINFKTNHLSAF